MIPDDPAKEDPMHSDGQTSQTTDTPPRACASRLAMVDR
jgi:hypothetical protein